ncbi:lichenan permease iic component (pts system lichenan-specific eiiccomponent) (eiic-lic) [Streptococcus pneumoniae]|nr:lichenan permease iic component (pts system lichenan-specific eiiccomponent) (eiic-lic) [Streptococcus pneumoniae]
MEKLLQEKLLPVAARLGNNKALVSIRDGITLTIPLLLIGSLLMVIASFPIPGWEKYLGDIGVADYLWKGVDSSFGLLGLVASFGVSLTLWLNNTKLMVFLLVLCHYHLLLQLRLSLEERLEQECLPLSWHQKVYLLL